MNRTSQLRSLGRTLGGLPLLSATLLSVVGLCWDGAMRDANAQAYGGASNPVIVNYDVLNALPGQPAPYGSTAPAGGQVRSQFLPGYAPLGAPTALPPYTPYGAAPSAYQPLPVAPGLAAGLPVAPGGTPTSAITTLGPDGRPIAPIKLKKPGSSSQTPKKNFAAPVQKADPVETAEPAPIPDEPTEPTQVAEVTPPAEPSEMPAEVPMPAGTPPAPEPGVNADAPEVEASMPDASVPEAPADEAPAESTESTEPPAEEEAPAEETATAEETPTEEATPEPTQEAAVAPSVEETPAEEAPAEQPTEEAAEEPADPDNAQPAPPVPEGGIRIVFPTEMNDVPPEANAALDDLAAQMLADENMRIQIMCYASGTVETESKARRKSLARCINIRQYLFKKDVRTTRMDVRALGLKAEGQPADRVDIVPPEAP